jgi:hypothetical protein
VCFAIRCLEKSCITPLLYCCVRVCWGRYQATAALYRITAQQRVHTLQYIHSVHLAYVPNPSIQQMYLVHASKAPNPTSTHPPPVQSSIHSFIHARYPSIYSPGLLFYSVHPSNPHTRPIHLKIYCISNGKIFQRKLTRVLEIMRKYMAHVLKIRKIVSLGSKSFEKYWVITLSADCLWNMLPELNHFMMNGKKSCVN